MFSMTNTSEVTGKDALDGLLDGVKHLPPTPVMLIKLIELFRDSDRDVDAVVGLMRQEPALTAEVLRRCNSSFFGSKNAVTDVRQAVFRVGFFEVYRMSVALFGMQSITKAKAANSIPALELWEHAATTAIIAGTLARELGESEGVAFTAGLLHDIGKIAMASIDEESYGKLLAENGPSGPNLNAAEKYEFGFTHGQVGARLLKRWGVPEQICTPVLCHHQETWSGEFERLGSIVNLANVMAHEFQKNAAGATTKIPEAAPAIKSLGILPEDLAQLDEYARSDVKRSLSRFAKS